MKFVFEQQVYDLGVRGTYFNIRQMCNLPSDDARIRAFVDDQLASVPDDMESSAPLVGFNSLHAAVSKRPDKLSASPVGLLAFFRAKRDIPRINGIVDVYNVISVSTGIAIGAHDLSHVSGDIELRLTKGDEAFWPLGSPKAAKVPAGEYSYVDSSNEILCRLEVRQVEKTKITSDSRDVFFIVQGHDSMDPALIATAGKRLSSACQALFGGQLEPLYP